CVFCAYVVKESQPFISLSPGTPEPGPLVRQGACGGSRKGPGKLLAQLRARPSVPVLQAAGGSLDHQIPSDSADRGNRFSSRVLSLPGTAISHTGVVAPQRQSARRLGGPSGPVRNTHPFGIEIRHSWPASIPSTLPPCFRDRGPPATRDLRGSRAARHRRG